MIVKVDLVDYIGQTVGSLEETVELIASISSEIEWIGSVGSMIAD